MNFAGFVTKWARATPDRPAVAVGSRIVLDYRALGTRVSALAGGLRSMGLMPGDRVAILMKNAPEYFECLFACWHAGLAVVPINAKLHPREAGFIIAHSEARLCLATPGLADDSAVSGDTMVRIVPTPSADYAALLDSAPIPMQPRAADDLAWQFYTSGTTGRPKGAMITHRNLLTMSFCYLADVDDVPPWRSILHPAPLSHGSGMYALAHLMKGSCQVVPESAAFQPDEIFALLGAWPGSVFFAAPTMVRRLTTCVTDLDVRVLKAIIFGGAPMHVADILACLERFGPRLAQLYGQGESPMTITAMTTAMYADRSNPRWSTRLASAGIAQSGVEVRTVDAQGMPIAAGEVGEIICRGDSVMPGYWNDSQATQRALRDGWLWTGDMGSLDDDGFLTLHDRSKDVIISGGSNIYPREVEEVLLHDPAVAEVSVIGVPDAEWGEVVVAWIAPRPGMTPDPSALDKRCIEHIARFKRPKHYRFVDALPKNNYGKILKTELRKREQTLGDKKSGS